MPLSVIDDMVGAQIPHLCSQCSYWVPVKGMLPVLKMSVVKIFGISLHNYVPSLSERSLEHGAMYYMFIMNVS